METITITLRPAAPFDWGLSLDFLADFGPMREEQRIEGRRLTKALLAAGQPVLIDATDAGSVEEPLLECRISARSLTPAAADEAAERLGQFLSLDDDLLPFYQRAAGDERFAPILRQLHGYHQVRFGTPFEAACWSILTQRNMLAIAYPMKLALVRRIGNAIEAGGDTFYAFPSAGQVAALEPDELQSIIGHSQKGLWLHSVAQAWSAADESWLRAAPTAEIAAWLRGIKGIGAWSENFILLRGLGRMDQLPRDNKWLDQAVERVYGPGRANQAERLAARYGPWQGYWAHYLRVAG